MTEIKINEIDENSLLKSFDCGNPSINELIKRSYFPHILNQKKVYKVSVDNWVLGYYSLSFVFLNLENAVEQVGDYYDTDPSFAAIKIDFIAIDRRLQKHGIGTYVLEIIVRASIASAEKEPVRLLIVDAITEKIDWYKKRAFIPLYKYTPEGEPTTKLYYDLLPPERWEKIHSLINDN